MRDCTSSAATGRLMLTGPFETELHLVDLDALPWDELPLHELHPQELERVQRYVFERDRRRHAACRLALRRVLAEACGVTPRAIEFTEGPHGKPSAPALAGLHFNVSHSGAAGLIGVCRSHELGVDIELLREMQDASALARHNFTADEQVELAQSADDTARSWLFLQGWTRKEACLKAIGSGLSVAPHTFHAGLAAQDREVLLALPGTAQPARVQLHTVALGNDRLAAVAWRQPA